jgi:heterodisulfide reductase subunit C
LTETINALKRLAAAEGRKDFRQSTNMYRTFMDTVQRYGRLREMEFMNRYFLSMKNPLFPLRFAALGLKLMLKRKTPLEAPRLLGAGRFDRLFRKVRDLEETQL